MPRTLTEEGAINVLNSVNMAGFEFAVYFMVPASSKIDRFAEFCAFSAPDPNGGFRGSGF